jgi:hypothetical protein
MGHEDAYHQSRRGGHLSHQLDRPPGTDGRHCVAAILHEVIHAAAEQAERPGQQFGELVCLLAADQSANHVNLCPTRG